MLRVVNRCFFFNQWTFWIYNDGINRTKGPFVMFMGHIGVPTAEVLQRHELYRYF